MMQLDEYRRYDLTGLAELISGGEVTADEVHDTARRAIAEDDTELNAVADGPWEQPLAYDAQGPFAGAPFVVKDLLCHPAEVPTRLGSRLTGPGLAMGHDTFLMQRFREAGLATMALSTTPELGFSATTEAVVYGPTRNPWDPTRSPGGSSGGSAALVAAGAVPAGHANDSAGSIRIPASACGLVGLKPSRGRVPVGPDAQEVVFGQAVEFAVTRTVRDAAALLDAVSGPMPGEKVALPRPVRSFRDELRGETGPLRVAVHTGDTWAGTPLDPRVRGTVERVAAVLESLGHHVEPATPWVDWEALVASQVTIWCAALADAVTAISAGSGLPPSEETLERVTLAAYQHGAAVSVLEFQAALATVNEISRHVGGFFTEWDVLLTPTLNRPAWPLGELDQDEPGLSVEGWFRRTFDERCSFTPLFNLSGTPAISLPLGATGDGLPIGVQLASGAADEVTLLRVAAQLERALPGQGGRPAVAAARRADTVAPG